MRLREDVRSQAAACERLARTVSDDAVQASGYGSAGALAAAAIQLASYCARLDEAERAAERTL